MSIDSYRFLDFASRHVMKAWAAREEPGVIPFTPLAKPLRECTVALVSTAGIARNDDRPFDQERERREPWWGDPSFRVIPLGTTEEAQEFDSYTGGQSEKQFILHYNFPNDSVGETGRISGPGRREIGHDALAERSIEPVVRVIRLVPQPSARAPPAA